MAEKISAYMIKWEDSAHVAGWRFKDNLPKPVIITTIGWVLQKTPDYVTVTTSVSRDHEVMAPMSIPISCIKSMKRLPYHIDAV